MTDNLTIGGTSFEAANTNATTLVRPAADNLLSLGITTYRWKDVQAVDMHASAAIYVDGSPVVTVKDADMLLMYAVLYCFLAALAGCMLAFALQGLWRGMKLKKWLRTQAQGVKFVGGPYRGDSTRL